ncbi:hypothetical protein [Treponema pedis]|uniref:hypothetical protein n=1 Tax=Treponema pedis TaxID=409322 RepID=UPI00041E0651|nr:hypothetical protein [Treponema pedis]
MRILKNIYASIYKEMIYYKRTLVNTIISMILFYAIFFLLWNGIKIASGSVLTFGADRIGILIGYYSWTMILSVYTSVGYIIAKNRDTGILENMIINSNNFTFLLIIESMVSTLLYCIFSWVNIFVFSLISGSHIYFRIFSTTYVLIVGLISVLGISLFIAGITIIFKKASAILSIFQFIFLAVLFIPANFVARLLLPFIQANEMLKIVFEQGISVIRISPEKHLLLWANAALYLICGIVVFNLCIKSAKRKGYLRFF